MGQRVLVGGGAHRDCVGAHLTIHSSRTRFAGRLNSGVRPLCRQTTVFCEQLLTLTSYWRLRLSYGESSWQHLHCTRFPAIPTAALWLSFPVFFSFCWPHLPMVPASFCYANISWVGSCKLSWSYAWAFLSLCFSPSRPPCRGLTIHSSRTCFAGRLNSSVRPHKWHLESRQTNCSTLSPPRGTSLAPTCSKNCSAELPKTNSTSASTAP